LLPSRVNSVPFVIMISLPPKHESVEKSHVNNGMIGSNGEVIVEVLVMKIDVAFGSGIIIVVALVNMTGVVASIEFVVVIVADEISMELV
jgi:hypothetical protein